MLTVIDKAKMFREIVNEMADLYENLYAPVPGNPVFRGNSGVHRLLEHGGTAADPAE